MANSTFHIGELSNLFNISVDSIRYYEKKGLICPTRNENNGYREYSLDDFQTLVMIRELLGLDFHKEQISEFLKNGNVRYGAFYYKGKDGSSSKEKGADCQPDSVFASCAE